ncbi:hypothetical protein BGZ94_005930 [Podila epigama]|nr:hypothetical protein BGZ94_005930 [Podila epigama]
MRAAAAAVPLRRATFSNTTPTTWQIHTDVAFSNPSAPAPAPASAATSQSQALCTPTAPCPNHTLTPSQRQFAKCFPELADLHPSHSPCAPCLATPPHTPPDFSSTQSSSPALASLLQTQQQYAISHSAANFSQAPSDLQLPDTEYTCTLERDDGSRYQGVIYVTSSKICFVGEHQETEDRATCINIRYRDLASLSQQSKNSRFPNSLRIRTSAAHSGKVRSYTLTGFTHREQVYTDIHRRWSLHQHSQPRNCQNSGDSSNTSSKSRTQYPSSDTLVDLEDTSTNNANIPEAKASTHSIPSVTVDHFSNTTTYTAKSQDRTARTERSFSSDGGSVSTMSADSADHGEGSDSLSEIFPRIIHQHQTMDGSACSRSSRNNVHQRRPSVESNMESIHAKTVAAPIAIQANNRLYSAYSPNKSITGRVNRSSSDSRSESILRASSTSDHGEGSDSLSGLFPRSSYQHRSRDSRSWTSHHDARQRRPSVDSDVDSIAHAQSKTFAAPIAIQLSSSYSSSTSPSLRSQAFKSPTPPPSLLSPSLTTTKISRSSSTIQSLRDGPTQRMSVHVRKDSQGELLETTNEADMDIATTVTMPSSSGSMSSSASHQSMCRGTSTLTNDTGATVVPAPLSSSTSVSCGCSRHFEHALLSTIVPLPVATCFEVLFSGRGTGSGDVLCKEAHQAVDGSLDFKISSWKNEGNALKLDTNSWKDMKRQLEYFVSFKVPICKETSFFLRLAQVTKTSATCLETQEIVHHSNQAVSIKVETTMPNVPYGEQFSTVHQICMTWNSSGNTRIKCFVEVNVHKKLIWSNNLESSLIERSSGYYHELIRRLVDYADKLDHRDDGRPTAATAAASTSSSLPVVLKLPPSDRHLTTSSTPPNSTVCLNSISDIDGTEPKSTVERSEPSNSLTSEMSPAHSLLSQQHLRHPPTYGTKSGSRASMDIHRPNSALVVPSAAITKPRPSTLDRKWSLSFLQSVLLMSPILADAASPPKTLKANKETSPLERPITNEKSEKDSAMVVLWTDIKRLSLAIFTKDDAAKAIATSQSKDSASAKDDSTLSKTGVSDGNTSSSLEETEAKNSGTTDEGYRVAPIIPGKPADSTATTNMASTATTTTTTIPVSLYHLFSGRATFMLVVVVMAISVVNMWYLFGVLSSVVQVVQEKHEFATMVPPYVTLAPKFAPSSSAAMAGQPKQQPWQRVGHDHSEALAPIQSQTELLRSEIKELLGMLEQALKARPIFHTGNKTRMLRWTTMQEMDPPEG